MSARHRLLLPAAALLLGITACTSTPVAAPGPISPVPVSAAPISAAPAEAPSPVVVTRTPARKPGCPSAKALEKLHELPKDTYFVQSTVKCWKGWATTGSKGPYPGDGIYLFRYKAATGWKFHSEGSGYHCEDLGIKESAPFCQYP